MIRIVLRSLTIVIASELALESASAQIRSEIKVTAVAGKIDATGRQTVVITMDFGKGWYAFANRVGAEDLAHAATTVTVTGKHKLEDVLIDYPAGKVLKNDLVGDYRIYDDKAEIKAVVRRAKGDDSHLLVSVSYLPNNPWALCMRPETVKLIVP